MSGSLVTGSDRNCLFWANCRNRSRCLLHSVGGFAKQKVKRTPADPARLVDLVDGELVARTQPRATA